jgi:hypothetical protein
MDNVFDVFNADAFGFQSLTASVNRMPFVPGRAGRLGVFEEDGVPTTSIVLEEESGLLSLVPNTPRGGPDNEHAFNNALARLIAIPHFPLSSTIMPDAVQNVRLFGGGSNLATVEAVVQKRQRQMVPKLDATVEYGRIGAIKGTILDADGSTTILNLFTTFGVSQTVIDFTLGTSTTNQLANVTAVAGAIEDELGDATYDHIHCFMGKTFFANFTGHASVQNAFHLWQDKGQLGAFFREDMRYEGFPFGPCIIEQYRGKVGGIPFVADNEAYFFPVGVPGLFITRFGPADWVEAVNTMGLPRYSKQWLDPNGGKYIRLATQTNAISICTRPAVLIKGTTTN